MSGDSSLTDDILVQANQQATEKPARGNARDIWDPEGGLLSFFTLDGLQYALDCNDWTIRHEVELLSNIAKDTTASPDIRMTAAGMIRAHVMSAMKLNGMVKDQTGTVRGQLPDGREMAATTVETRLMTGLAKQTDQKLLEAALISENVIEASGEAKHDTSSESEENSHVEKEAQPVRRSGEPLRDLGGGGLCKSAQRKARADRDAEARAAGGSTSEFLGIPQAESQSGPDEPDGDPDPEELAE